MNRFVKLFLICLAILSFQSAHAQYFGQNKVKYKNFDFKVVESKTFDTYHYLEKDSLVIGLIKDAEKWRLRHEQIFKDTFDYKVPIILYNNHGDFQQTSVVGGLIGPGTGGVTEGLKNRVTFPVTPSYAQTDHVMGHELVHAHQYNMIKSSDSLSFNNMANIPLWMTEGMAEYLSIGSYDAPTAMWMRDAVAHDYFPAIKDLYKSRYFPYRFGHAFWAFVGGTFGDEVLFPLYNQTARIGVKEAFKKDLGMSIDSFSKRWKSTTDKFYKPQMKGRVISALGTKLVDKQNGGRLNISPSVSPNGKYFIFLSERNIFSLDLFLADANTGKIIRKLSTRTRKTHLDALDAFESAGTWSPDSKQYAFVIYSGGKNKIAIADVDKGRVINEFFVPEVPSFSNIDWSPDGDKILFSGLRNGQSDLFTITLKTKEVTQITDDYFAQMQPKWSPDGKNIVFVTDHFYKEIPRPTKNLTFALLDLENKKIEMAKVFPNANNLNPTYSADGRFIYFLSDRESFRDIYQYEIETEIINQLTNFFTGVSGITKYSPAITVSSEKNEILYSHYSDSKYAIYKVKVAELKRNEVAFDDENFDLGKLPSLNLKQGFVDANIKNEAILARTDRLIEKDYKAKFQLDYISNGGVGISTSRYGTGMAGGINMLFGDMLNDNQLYVGAVLNGELQDFGAQAAYLNRKSRYAWGGGLSHIPYRYGYEYYKAQDTIIDGNYSNIQRVTNIYRIFTENASVFSYYPFSKATRVEVGASLNYYSFRLTKYTYDLNYIDYYNQYLVKYNKESSIKIEDSFGSADVNLAYVGDTSSFGLTAPMNGHRYRFEVQQSFGKYNTTSLLGDARKYFYTKPLTFAFRGYQYARFGKIVDNPLNYPLYLGYGNLVRGYTFNSLGDNTNQLSHNDLLGSRMALANFEVRLPFSGPEQLAVFKSGFLFTDINLFFDAGVVWGDYKSLDTDTNEYIGVNRSLENSEIITSTGVSLRINLFGQLIIEPYYAFPLQLDRSEKGVFGINFTPGW